MAFHRTTYTIGFMGWYDTFKNTKINYYLIPLGLAQGPLIYLYVRTIALAPFTWRRYDLWHFLPVGLYFIYRILLLMHDRQGVDWEVGYQGDWMQSVHLIYVEPFYSFLVYTSQVLYLAFTVQLFYQYQRKIRQYFSNTFQVELNWIRNFLALYILLFIYSTISDIIDAFIFELKYVHRWWYHLLSAIVLLYLSMKAYFTDISRLHQLTFDLVQAPEAVGSGEAHTLRKQKERLAQTMQAHSPHLRSDLTLRDLAAEVGLSLHDVSETINQGFGVNFNEYINQHRIEEVKQRLLDKQYDHLSLVAIAYDCGFNSKATFNRVFKRHTGQSPSQFKSNHRTATS